MMRLSTIDIADPQVPIVLSEVTVPASTSWDVDGPRQLLVLFHGQTDEVFAFDVRADEPVQLGGRPLFTSGLTADELEEWFEDGIEVELRGVTEPTIQRGAINYLRKPIEQSDLVGVVEDGLAKVQAIPAVEPPVSAVASRLPVPRTEWTG